MKTEITVEITKPKIPLIWLDTSIISKIAFSNLKEKITGRTVSLLDMNRVNIIYNLLYKKVREQEVICPIAEQIEELELIKLEANEYKLFIEECTNIINNLSLGAKIKPRESIRKHQLKKAVQAFLNKKSYYKIDFTSIFKPSKILDFLGGKIFITFPPVFNKNVIEHNNKLKTYQWEELNISRKSNIAGSINFGDALKKEYNGGKEFFDIFEYRQQKSLSKEYSLTFNDLNTILNINHIINLFPGKDYEDRKRSYIEFLSSPYYRSIPEVTIHAKLYAKKKPY